jgi:hypothetical protein
LPLKKLEIVVFFPFCGADLQASIPDKPVDDSSCHLNQVLTLSFLCQFYVFFTAFHDVFGWFQPRLGLDLHPGMVVPPSIGGSDQDTLFTLAKDPGHPVSNRKGATNTEKKKIFFEFSSQ